jgi:hypothetical protein
VSTADGIQGVDPERRAAVALDMVSTSRRQWQREHRRPSALTPREALAALQFEALLVWTAAANVRNNILLTDGDFDRLSLSCRWIDSICAEVLR